MKLKSVFIAIKFLIQFLFGNIYIVKLKLATAVCQILHISAYNAKISEVKPPLIPGKCTPYTG